MRCGDGTFSTSHLTHRAVATFFRHFTISTNFYLFVSVCVRDRTYLHVSVNALDATTLFLDDELLWVVCRCQASPG